MSWNLKAAWEKWTDVFLELPKERMSPDATKALLSLFFAERDRAQLPPEITENFLFKVLRARAASLDLKISQHALALIASISANPGNCVMYAHALRRAQLKDPTLGEITLAIICEKLFPTGFLPDTALSLHWDEQKGYKMGQSFDNMLDIVSSLDLQVV